MKITGEWKGLTFRLEPSVFLFHRIAELPAAAESIYVWICEGNVAELLPEPGNLQRKHLEFRGKLWYSHKRISKRLLNSNR